MEPSRPEDEAFSERPQGSRPPPVPPSEDEEYRRRPRREGRPLPAQGGDDVLSSLIPYRNGQALAAYYLGVFSLIPCIGLVLALIAIILGVLGINYAKRNPTAKGTGHAIAGLVLGTLSLVGHLAVVAIWFAMVMGAGGARR
jgi:hypothetical protein